MRLAPEITLVRLSDRDGPRCSVLISNQETATELQGCVLEASVQCPSGWLLFVTDDVPFEDMLSIYLLDQAGRLLDWARLGGPYTTGVFSNLRLEPPATVHFRFIDDADWSVEVRQRARFAMPWLPDAKGVIRGGGLARHFDVLRR